VNKPRRFIHCKDLPEAIDGPLATEINTYRRMVGPLLGDRQDNRWVLIKGQEIIGIWDTREEALAVAAERFPQQPALIRQILEWEFFPPLPDATTGAPEQPAHRDEALRPPQGGGVSCVCGRMYVSEGKRTIHWTELPEDTSGGPIATESNFYRRAVGRLLAEGHENRWALIKGEEIIGIWDTREEAFAVASERYLLQPVLVQQILENEPVLRLPYRWRRWLK
jgi:hypothetical protein